MATVQFPDGTTVEAVGIQERRPDQPGRDYGFYLRFSGPRRFFAVETHSFLRFSAPR